MEVLKKPTSTPIPLPPKIEYQHVEDTGKTVLWIVFVIMLLSSVIFTLLAYRTQVNKRLFHVLTAFITTFATLSYFAMATGDGNSFTRIVIPAKDSATPATELYRQVFWARYVDWAVTTPLLLLDLSFLAGLNGANILVAVVADVIMVVFGLFGAVSAESNGTGQKWGYYTFACIAFVVVIYQLAVPGSRAVLSKDASTKRLFSLIGLFTLVLWTLYPVVWALGEGVRIWSVDGEILAYAILDVLAKPGFGFWLLFARQGGSPKVEGWWSHGLNEEGNIRIPVEDD